MNRDDLELLDKQLWGVSADPPQSSIVIVLVVIAVFLAGIAIGDFLFVHQNKSLQTNSHLDQFTSQIEMNPSGLGGGS